MDSRLFCGNVFQSTFSRAAFTSAARAVVRSVAVARADLDLAGPDRVFPVEFEDDVSESFLAPIDLSAPPGPLSQDILVPAVGSLSTK